MGSRLGPLEVAVHLGLFVVGGAVLGLLALAFLERLAPGERRIVRWAYVGAAAVLFFALFAAERVYHALM